MPDTGHRSTMHVAVRWFRKPTVA